MKNGKLLIAIVNSSSFGISFPEHLRALSAFAELIRVEMPEGRRPRPSSTPGSPASTASSPASRRRTRARCCSGCRS